MWAISRMMSLENDVSQADKTFTSEALVYN
jgi:hypothetical protein